MKSNSPNTPSLGTLTPSASARFILAIEGAADVFSGDPTTHSGLTVLADQLGSMGKRSGFALAGPLAQQIRVIKKTVPHPLKHARSRNITIPADTELAAVLRIWAAEARRALGIEGATVTVTVRDAPRSVVREIRLGSILLGADYVTKDNPYFQFSQEFAMASGATE